MIYLSLLVRLFLLLFLVSPDFQLVSCDVVVVVAGVEKPTTLAAALSWDLWAWFRKVHQTLAAGVVGAREATLTLWGFLRLQNNGEHKRRLRALSREERINWPSLVAYYVLV